MAGTFVSGGCQDPMDDMLQGVWLAADIFQPKKYHIDEQSFSNAKQKLTRFSHFSSVVV